MKNSEFNKFLKEALVMYLGQSIREYCECPEMFLDRIKCDKADINRLESMTYDQRREYGVDRRNKLVQHYEKLLRDYDKPKAEIPHEEKVKNEAFLEKVKQLKVKHSEAIGFKKNLIAMLEFKTPDKPGSDRDISEMAKEGLKVVKKKGPFEYWSEDLQGAKHSLEYCEYQKREYDLRREWINNILENPTSD